MAQKQRTRLPDFNSCKEQGTKLAQQLFKEQINAFTAQLQKWAAAKYHDYITIHPPSFQSPYYASIHFTIDDAREEGYIRIHEQHISFICPDIISSPHSHLFQNITTVKELTGKFKIIIDSVCPR